MNFLKILLVSLCLIVSSVGTPAWCTSSTCSVIEQSVPPVKPGTKDPKVRKRSFKLANDTPPKHWRSFLNTLSAVGMFAACLAVVLYFFSLLGLLTVTGYLYIFPLIGAILLLVLGIHLVNLAFSKFHSLQKAYKDQMPSNPRMGFLFGGQLAILLGLSIFFLFFVTNVGFMSLIIGTFIVGIGMGLFAFFFPKGG